MIIAFDIDGTIANNGHREHLATAQKWPEFHALAHLDPPLQETLAVLHALHAAGHQIEIWTARDDSNFHQTTAWLAQHGVPDDVRLVMRRNGDWRRAFILKLEWYLQREPKLRPRLVFEDHPEIVRLLRAAGACVHQVAEGRYPA